MKVNWKCFFKDHKIADYRDGGYEICERCQCHEFFDGYNNDWHGQRNYWLFTLPSIWRRKKQIMKWTFEWQMRKVYTQCKDCGKIETLFGKPKGKHDKCLPF
jgi:hypothetical protein